MSVSVPILSQYAILVFIHHHHTPPPPSPPSSSHRVCVQSFIRLASFNNFTHILEWVVYKFIANNEGMKYLSGRFKWWFCALFFSFHLTTWKPIRFFLLFSSSSYCSFQWPLHLLLQIHSINFSDSWLKYIKLIVWFFGCMFVHLTGSFYWNHWWVVHSPPSFTASRVPFYLNGCI